MFVPVFPNNLCKMCSVFFDMLVFRAFCLVKATWEVVSFCLFLACVSVEDSSLHASTTGNAPKNSMDVLNSYKEYLSSIDGVEFKYMTSLSNSDVVIVRFKGDRFWTLVTTYEGENLKAEVATTEVAIVGSHATVFNRDSRAPRSGETSVRGVLNKAVEHGYTMEHFFEFPFIFGYYAVESTNDIRYIPDLFQHSNVETEVIGGKQLIVLRKSEGDLLLTLWIDPESSYAAKKIKVERQSGELQAGRVIRRESEIEDFSPTSGTYFPRKFYEERQNVGRTYEQKDGKPVEKLFITEGKRRYVEISDVRFDKPLGDDSFRLTSPIIDGTQVHIRDAPHIEYIWFDGKVVPKTDEIMLAIARGGHKFMPGPAEPRFWMLTIGIILILLGGGRLAYKHFTDKD